MLIIDDNFLTQEEVLKYANLDHRWSLSNLSNPKNVKDSFFPEFETEEERKTKTQFVHVVKAPDFEQEKLSKDLSLLVERFAKKNNLEILEILRIKFNLMTSNKSIKNKVNKPHVDFSKKFFESTAYDPDTNHFVLLCYINDSDGSTIIYNEKDPFDSLKGLSIKEKINPKAGRAIFFEGDQYHSSSFPSEYSNRMVLNINLIGKINND
jgi:hypothetical protein